ncbi:MAG: antirestriction protein ArdA [Firmicutes bacterium]|nr:antirestriction protein ArdA [Bacillota bacterium]
MSDKKISAVIGSWGSYNECNERALGSEWPDFSDYSDWEEIEAELVKQGFVLDGIDEELFIQDIEGLPSGCANWDHTSPQRLFMTLYEAGVLEESYKYDAMLAFLEVRCYSDFEELVKSKGFRWDDDIRIYPGFDWADYGREMFECCEHRIDDRLLDFFDFEAYGKYVGDCCAEEWSGGIIEILE